MAGKLAKISSPKKKKEQKVKIKHVKPKASTTGTAVKPFVFITGESKWLGDEPQWVTQPNESNRFSKMARAFTWYNYYFSNKEAKAMFLQWLEVTSRKDEAKLIKGIHENEYKLTSCWLARMSLMGLELLDAEKLRLESTVTELKSYKQAVIEEKTAEKKPSIQDRLQEKLFECASEVDGIFDDFVKTGAKWRGDISPINVFKAANLVPSQAGYISDIWQKELAEFKLALTDKEVAEYYSGYSKIQLKNMIKFAEQVIADCVSYVQVKKVERKPRAKKTKTPEQLARGFKYLRQCTELKLKSEAPAKIVAAQEAWLYDTAKRKLIHVVADMNAGSLTIKGTSIVGFGEKDTVQKTLRKPAEQLKEIFAGGKPAARKAFKDVKSTEAKWAGRSNENIVILKVW